MKKRYVQKMLTMALTAAMICSSVPVSAETVSENETAVTVEEADKADQAETEDTEVENGKEGYLSYRIYQKPDKTKYVKITECDYDAKGAVEIPTKIKDIAVTSIRNYAFYGCRRLTSIEIPSSVTSIGNYAFYGCRGLTSIEIPSSVTSIGDYAFSGCSGVTSINVEAGNVVYDSRDNCNAIIETKTNTLIQGCKNTKIPSSVTKIGDRAISGCSGLTSIEIPAGVTEIGDYAFRGCSGLTSIEIPAGVTSIGDYAFSGCSGLTSIVVEAGNTVYDSRDNCNAIIEKATNTLIRGCNNTKIPSSVTSIGHDAFGDCSGLTSIEIPSSVTSIGHDAFYKCSGLTSMEIPAGVTKIGDRAFLGCSGLTSIEIPSSVTSIGNYAFYGCSGLTSIEIPEGVTSIENGAFKGCSGLTSIKIPSSVTSIKNEAFEDCIGLTSINVEAGNVVYDSRDNCNAIIEKETNTLIQGCKNTKIPSSVTRIGYYAFSGCSGLTSIEIPASVTSIKYAAFSGCSGLTDIEIPSSITNIEEAAFSGCSGLTSINVEAGNVVYDSRDNCNAIIEKETNTLIQGCKNTKIPSSVTNIGNYAFGGCSGLTSIEIPSSVTSIGEGAFMDCSGLKDVYYTGTQEQWNAINFSNGGDASDVFVAYDKDLSQNISIPFTLHCNSSRPKPSQQPSAEPSQQPSAEPSQQPSAAPSPAPSAVPSKTPEADLPAAGTTLKEKTGREFKVTESDGSESKPSVTLTKLSAKDKKAKKVTIPKTVTINNVKYRVTGIAAKAFKNSKKLQSIVIPDTITEIGAGSFEGCKNLKSVTIGKNVTSIGKNAFKNCKNLKKITVKSTKLKKVGKGALTGINRKCVIKVPKKQLKSYKRLFKGKGQKKSVKIKK